MAELLASIILPVRNDRGRHLRELIAALERQTLPRDRFELVIGDDGSTDGSLDNIATEDGWIRVVRGEASNAYTARNRAAAIARAPVLVFVDSDCVPEPEWLERGIAALEDADAAAGLIRFTLPERRTIWTLIDIDSTKDHERQVEQSNAETANLFVRRELFDLIGGFDDDEPGHGDFDFAIRCVEAGGKLVFARDAMVWHPTRDSGRSFLGNVWEMHRSYAAREARARRKPLGLKLRWWVPFVMHARWRLRSGRSLGLDKRWLGENEVPPRLRDNLRAVPLLYVLLPYLQGAAQIRGWYDGVRTR